jgi:hypothetical protein
MLSLRYLLSEFSQSLRCQGSRADGYRDADFSSGKSRYRQLHRLRGWACSA